MRYVGLKAIRISQHHGSKSKEVQDGWTKLIQQKGFKTATLLQRPLKNHEQLEGIESFQKIMPTILEIEDIDPNRINRVQIFKNMLSHKRVFSKKKISQSETPSVLE